MAIPLKRDRQTCIDAAGSLSYTPVYGSYLGKDT